jgi:hypothetical protein
MNDSAKQQEIDKKVRTQMVYNTLCNLLSNQTYMELFLKDVSIFRDEFNLIDENIKVTIIIEKLRKDTK